MAKQLNDKQLQDLNFKKEWCLTILDFMSCIYKNAQSPKMLIELINEEYRKQNLKGFRFIFSDINEMSKNLTDQELKDLNKILKSKFGEDLKSQTQKGIIKIEKIKKRGIILTENEFRLVESRVEDIYADESKKEELDTLNNLLNKYYVEHNCK
ncbi:MAG: hypothetical protein WCT77_03250 [Bacteroidota bacterium]